MKVHENMVNGIDFDVAYSSVQEVAGTTPHGLL